MADRRFNADIRLDSETRRKVDELKRGDPNARRHFENVREAQLRDHPPVQGTEHSPAQRANATQMADKAVAIDFLGWP